MSVVGPVTDTDMQSIIGSFVRRFATLRELGPLAGSLFAVKRLLEGVSAGRVRVHAYHLVAQPVKEAPMLGPRRGRSIEVREVDEAEVVSLPVPRPGAVISDRFRQGARCLAAYADGKFVGFLWYLVGPYEEDEVRCRFVPLPAGQASWDFDVYVDPSARLGLAFARLWDEANARLSSRGIRWSLSRISAFNAGSLAAHGRLGLARVASAVFLCAGSLQVTFASVRPFLHVAIGRRSRPVMELRADRTAPGPHAAGS